MVAGLPQPCETRPKRRARGDPLNHRSLTGTSQQVPLSLYYSWRYNSTPSRGCVKVEACDHLSELRNAPSFHHRNHQAEARLLQFFLLRAGHYFLLSWKFRRVVWHLVRDIVVMSPVSNQLLLLAAHRFFVHSLFSFSICNIQQSIRQSSHDPPTSWDKLLVCVLTNTHQQPVSSC